MTELERVRELYETRYRLDYRNRDYEWHPRNFISLIHAHLFELEVVRALNALNIELVDQRILDVGCGYGRLLRFWAEMGAEPSLLFGCDLALYRLERARTLSSRMCLVVANAGQLPYPSASFDLVSQCTVFSSILDDGLRARAAREMIRVLKPGGSLLWYDLAIGGSERIRPVPKAELFELFRGLHVRYLRGIFGIRLKDRIQTRPRLAIIMEHLGLSRKSGLVVLFQRPRG